MKAFKAFFLSRLMREKVLLLAFIGLAVLIWLSSFGGRASIVVKEFRRTSEELNLQRMWLSRRAAIETGAQKAIAQLDPAKTFNATRLLAEVSNVAKSVGLSSTQSDESNDEPGNQFVLHNLRFRVNKADYDTLKKFDQEIQKRSPYIGLKSCSIRAEANPAQLTAVFSLSSVEVVR